MHIEIHEDNSGAVYLTRNGETWTLGPVTPDMYGEAAATARAWQEGEWVPSEHDGQQPADPTCLDHIGTWTPTGLVVERDSDSEPVAGAGGALFLGIATR